MAFAVVCCCLEIDRSQPACLCRDQANPWLFAQEITENGTDRDDLADSMASQKHKQVESLTTIPSVPRDPSSFAACLEIHPSSLIKRSMAFAQAVETGSDDLADLMASQNTTKSPNQKEKLCSFSEAG